MNPVVLVSYAGICSKHSLFPSVGFLYSGIPKKLHYFSFRSDVIQNTDNQSILCLWKQKKYMLV